MCARELRSRYEPPEPAQPWSPAGGALVMLPVLFFSILVRKFLVHGLSAGALER